MRPDVLHAAHLGWYHGKESITRQLHWYRSFIKESSFGYQNGQLRMSYWRVVCFAGGREQQSHALHTYKRHLEKLTYQHLSADCKGLIAGKYYLPESGDFRADHALLSILSPTASQKGTLVY